MFCIHTFSYYFFNLPNLRPHLLDNLILISTIFSGLFAIFPTSKNIGFLLIAVFYFGLSLQNHNRTFSLLVTKSLTIYTVTIPTENMIFLQSPVPLPMTLDRSPYNYRTYRLPFSMYFLATNNSVLYKCIRYAESEFSLCRSLPILMHLFCYG